MDETGRRYLSGINCTPELAQKSFLATKNLYGKANGTFFYQYVQSFSPQEEAHPWRSTPNRPGTGGAVLPRLRGAGGHAHGHGTPALPPDRQLGSPGHREKAALHAQHSGADAEGQRPALRGARPQHLEAIPTGSAHPGPADRGIPGSQPGRELEVPADHHNRGSHEARRDAGGIPA